VKIRDLHKRHWTHRQALEFIEGLEEHIAPHYHIAMMGSVLHHGWSSKDLDIIIFPHTTAHSDLVEIHELLVSFGMSLRLTCAEIHKFWREKGSADEKWVEVYDYQRKRIDVFLPYISKEDH